MNENNGQARKGYVLVTFTRNEKDVLQQLASSNKRSVSGQVRYLVGLQLEQMK